MVHFRGGRAAIDPAVYPELDAFWGDLTAATRRRCAARRARLHVPAVRRHEPRLSERSEPAGVRRRHRRRPRAPAPDYIRHINEALAAAPTGMAVTTHMCRGNFRSSWVAEGGYDFVAEALFNELAGGRLLPRVRRRALGQLRAAALRPEGQAGRARPRDHEARRARGEGRLEAADRGGVALRRRSSSSACRPSAGSPRRSRATRCRATSRSRSFALSWRLQRRCGARDG